MLSACGDACGGVGLFPGAIATNISVHSGIMICQETEAMAKQGAAKFKNTPAPLAATMIIDAFESNQFHSFVGSDAKMIDILSRIMPLRAALTIQPQMASLLK